MVTAYVLVKASTGEVDRLKSAISSIDDAVRSVSVVAGDVDYVVKADVDDAAAIDEIAAAIREVAGIEATETYLARE
ncbi:MAG: Lrp/AsnC ligand binding domain-containing protein [Haloquadratum sp.]